jgi:predicted phosphoadenosine phosphosulfate sulfurtransferase
MGVNVFEAALDRLVPVFEAGHRVVVSFSAGKDSGTCLELCLIAARLTGRLPLDVVMRDEEVMFPGTFEYAERVAERDEVSFHWIYACQPVINAFNRERPYFWVFDPDLGPEGWVREPPARAYRIAEQNIRSLITRERFPTDRGLYDVVGLRADESKGRMMGIHSAGGHLTKPRAETGVIGIRPIYDWTDGDVWKAHLDNGWDYNRAYDAMHRLGLGRKKLRIAPPTMSIYGVDTLRFAAQAWPAWFDRVARRLPGVRTAAQYGIRSVSADRRLNESWEETYERECVARAPAWIAERSERVRELVVRRHGLHATTHLPENKPCPGCPGGIGSWKNLTRTMYLGDPFCLRTGGMLRYVEPEYFRPGAGTWGGAPAFA